MIRITLLAIAGFACGQVHGQSLEDYDFIDWAAGDLPLEPTVPDADFIAALQADQDNYGVRKIESLLHFRANGDVEQFYRLVLDYADAAGIETRGNAEAYVSSFSEQLRIEEAYVTTHDGSVIVVDPATVQVLLVDDGGIFSDRHTVVIPWPALAPGASSTIAYRTLSRGDRRAAPWSQLMFPQTSVPTGEFELTVTWDDGAEPPELNTDSAFAQCERLENAIQCNASDVKPIARDFDVNYYDELGHIVVAEPSKWGELVELLQGYVDGSFSDEETVAAMVEQLIAGADSEQEILQVLHSFVAEQIRYVAIEAGVNGVVPRDTGLTLSRRFGDCKDKTALFLHMARIAGLKAEPVVVSSHRKNLDRLITPSLSYFDHMVACVDLPEGRVCIDLTDPYTPTLDPPSYLNGAAALPLVDDAEEVVALPAMQLTWRVVVESMNVIDGDTIRERESRTYYGPYAGLLRASLASLNREERQRWAQDGYQEVFGTDVPVEFQFTGLNAQQEPVTIAGTVAYEGAIIPGERLSYEHYPGWLVDLVKQFHSPNEYYDYHFQGFGYRERTTFEVSEWEVLAPGATIAFASELGHMQRSYRVEGDQVIVYTEVEMPSRVVGIDEIDRFDAFIDTLVDNAPIRFRAVPR